jgi:hypothetical protein
MTIRDAATAGVTDRCPACGEVKPIAAFGRDRRRSAHCVDECLACQAICPEAWLARQSRRVRERREAEQVAVFGHYGRSCACCGVTDRLCIDHVNGDGEQHRAAIGGQHKIYRWLIDDGFPEGFQTLCAPCNSSKARNARCPVNHGQMTEV